MTEDAENMPAQMLRFINESSHKSDYAHLSVRSGVFGGYNQSVTESGNPSFRGPPQQMSFQGELSVRTPEKTSDNMLKSSHKLKKFVTQVQATQGTFGGENKYTMPSAAQRSPGNDKFGANSVVSGSDEEEVIVQEAMEDSGGQLD